MVCKEGQFDVVELTMNNQFKAFKPNFLSLYFKIMYMHM